MVAGTNRERRIAALETKTRMMKPINILLICANLGETKDAAVARYLADHGPLLADDGDTTTMDGIVLMPVATV